MIGWPSMYVVLSTSQIFCIRKLLKGSASRQTAGDSIVEDLMPASVHITIDMTRDTASVQHTVESARMPPIARIWFLSTSNYAVKKSPAHPGRLRRTPMYSSARSSVLFNTVEKNGLRQSKANLRALKFILYFHRNSKKYSLINLMSPVFSSVFCARL